MEEKVIDKAAQKKQISRLIKDNNSVLILVLILAVAFIFVDSYKNGFYNVLKYTAMYGPVCLGLGIVMITGNIDLSAGFMAGFSGVASVLAFNAVYNAGGSSVVALIVGIIIAIIVGGIMGFINGFFIAKVGISSLIATIAANYAYQGLVFYWAKSSFAPAETELVKVISQKTLGLNLEISGTTILLEPRWLTPSFIIFLVIIAFFTWWMYKSRFGNNIYVVGDNPEAGAYAGISVQKTVWVSYVLCGVLAAVSGFFMVSNAGYAIYSQGNSLSTLTISCCVIGGIKMTGGKGTAVSVLLGVLIMRAISQIMTSLFLSASLVNLITGLLLIIVLIIDRFTSNKPVE